MEPSWAAPFAPPNKMSAPIVIATTLAAHRRLDAPLERGASGHAAGAPPSSATTSRRFSRSDCMRSPGAPNLKFAHFVLTSPNANFGFKGALESGRDFDPGTVRLGA